LWIIINNNKHKDIRNEVRHNTRQLYKDEQNNIAKECKSNPKMFWNYRNSKTKCHNKIGDLSYTNDHGVETVVSNDLDRAKRLCIIGLHGAIYIILLTLLTYLMS